MSKSLKRVKRALEAAGWERDIRETALARTAKDAADALDCDVDQIAKSIIFADQDKKPVLFITAGGQNVDLGKASTLAGGPLSKADAAVIRAQTGFAIGGVSPVGHLSPIRAWMDPRLMQFDLVWAAAGTPHHVFSSAPKELLSLSGAQLAEFTA